MPYDTIFNYSHLCHCLHSFQFLQQNEAWILLTTLSLTTQPIIYADQPIQSVGAERYLPIAICWQSRNAEPYVHWCNFEVWRRTQLSHGGQLSSSFQQDCLCPLLLLASPDIALSCFPPLLPLWVPTVGLMPWCSPIHANAFSHLCSCSSPTVLLSPHILPLLPHSPTLTTTAPLYIPPWVNQIPFSFPSLCKHTQQTLSHKCQEEIYSQPFYLEINHREISVALSWNMPCLDGIFRCQNLTSLYQARTNCKDSNV